MTASTSRSTEARVGPSAALWASAFVILALILVKADDAGPAASADEMVVSRGDYTLLTTAGRGSDEIVVVIDNRSEALMVYSIDRRAGLEPTARLDLGKTFEDAKRWAGRK